MAEAARGREPVGEPEIVVLPDAEAVARAAAERLVTAVTQALALRPAAHVALTGGSSALVLYQELADAWREAVDWRRVHLWWGDDRIVPLDHPESNAGLAYVTLLQAPARSGASGTGLQGVDVNAGDAPGLPVPADNVHPFPIAGAGVAGADAGAIAQGYAAQLAALVPPGVDGVPAFDVLLLGVGPDGHILSVFPGSPGLGRDAPLVMAVPAPEHVEPHLPRVTLTPRVVETAGSVLVIVTGEDKASIVGRVLAPAAVGPPELPARLAVRPNATWLLDEPAAAQLDPSLSRREAGTSRSQAPR